MSSTTTPAPSSSAGSTTAGTTVCASISPTSWSRSSTKAGLGRRPSRPITSISRWHTTCRGTRGPACRSFRIPPVFGDRLFEFQEAAARIAARHVNRRGGVLIGDVVGLGKTLMATAVAKILGRGLLARNPDPLSPQPDRHVGGLRASLPVAGKGHVNKPCHKQAARPAPATAS